MKIALAQINPVIGDLKGNAELILSYCRNAAKSNSDLLITPELSLWGYPPRDLLLNPNLIENQWLMLDQMVANIAQETPTLKVLVGVAEQAPDFQLPKLFNSIALLTTSGSNKISE